MKNSWCIPRQVVTQYKILIVSLVGEPPTTPGFFFSKREKKPVPSSFEARSRRGAFSVYFQPVNADLLNQNLSGICCAFISYSSSRYLIVR
jgi:hypothetical protein